MPPEWFLVEVKVSDWPRSVAWYREILGLTPLLDDPVHQYALLGAAGGRIALQGGGAPDSGREAIRLTFRVDDLDAEQVRLKGLGVALGEPLENLSEGYRELRLSDPDGTSIRLFAWVVPRRP